MHQMPDDNWVPRLPLRRPCNPSLPLVPWITVNPSMDLPELQASARLLLARICRYSITPEMKQSLAICDAVIELSKMLMNHYEVLFKLSVPNLDGPVKTTKDLPLLINSFLPSLLIMSELAYTYLLQQRSSRTDGRITPLELFIIATGLQSIRKKVYPYLRISVNLLYAVEHATNERNRLYNYRQVWLLSYESKITFDMPWTELRAFKEEMLNRRIVVRPKDQDLKHGYRMWQAPHICVNCPPQALPALLDSLDHSLNIIFDHVRPYYLFSGGLDDNPFLRLPGLPPGARPPTAYNHVHCYHQEMLERLSDDWYPTRLDGGRNGHPHETPNLHGRVAGCVGGPIWFHPLHIGIKAMPYRKKILNVGHSAPTTCVSFESVIPIQPDVALGGAAAVEGSLSRNLPTLMNRARKWMTMLYYGPPAIATYYPEHSTDCADAIAGQVNEPPVSDGVENASSCAASSVVIGHVAAPCGEALRLRTLFGHDFAFSEISFSAADAPLLEWVVFSFERAGRLGDIRCLRIDSQGKATQYIDLGPIVIREYAYLRG
ncbi:hypothetical protein DFP73DRAFT_524676 [Morchella snyderi]|nr:hypothetical protein DFP73DRAFT_524676 [Morchella snyderi]